MVALSKTWTIELNVSFGSVSDRLAQYQAFWFAFVDIHRRAGWTVISSSDGVTAGAGDRILSAANIVPGTGGGVPRSWVVLSPPNRFYGKGGTVAVGEEIELMFAADTGTNRSVVMNRSIGTPYAGALTTANPTAAGSVSFGGSFTSTFVQWTNPLPARYSYWYSEDGEVMIGAKPDAQAGFAFWYMARTFTAAADGVGDYRPVFFGTIASTGGALTGVVFQTTGNFVATDYGGVSATSVRGFNRVGNLIAWTAGVEQNRSAFYELIRVMNNAAAGNARRDYGFFSDMWVGPAGGPMNRVFDGDSDAVRLFAVGSGLTQATIWLPAPRTQLPLL